MSSKHPLTIRANRLRKALAARLPLTHAQSLELVAREEGYSDWNTAQACYVIQPAEPEASLRSTKLEGPAARDAELGIAAHSRHNELMVLLDSLTASPRAHGNRRPGSKLPQIFDIVPLYDDPDPALSEIEDRWKKGQTTLRHIGQVQSIDARRMGVEADSAWMLFLMMNNQLFAFPQLFTDRSAADETALRLLTYPG